MKRSLEKILAFLTRATLRRYRPIIIGITGSVGKTSTKEAVFSVLRFKNARKSESNYNNEIGVPLTVLGIEHRGKNVFGWLYAFMEVIFKLVIRDPAYPKILILEMGADHPGDIRYLARLIHPTIGIITSVGEIPVHVEFFAGPKDVAREKGELIRALPVVDGLAILNADDDTLTDLRDSTNIHSQTFGFDEHADMKISDLALTIDYSMTLQSDVPEGIGFVLTHDSAKMNVKLRGAFGKPQAYAAAAAALVGICFGMTLPEIAHALELYNPPPGRLRLLKGIKGSWILDDSYNSSPQALHSALDTLKNLPGKRKIAVLGDMLELGEYTEAAHRTAGDKVAQIADMLVTVGPRAKFIAEEAMSGGLENTKVLAPQNIHSFETSYQAGEALDPMIQKGDLILIKGSQGIRMEKVTEAIMAEPERAGELLVRQNEYWKGRP